MSLESQTIRKNSEEPDNSIIIDEISNHLSENGFKDLDIDFEIKDTLQVFGDSSFTSLPKFKVRMLVKYNIFYYKF